MGTLRSGQVTRSYTEHRTADTPNGDTRTGTSADIMDRQGASRHRPDRWSGQAIDGPGRRSASV